MKLKVEAQDRDPKEKSVKETITATIPSPYLTAEEAAGYLRTTIQGIYSLIKRGKLRSMPGRPGRLLFTRESLDAYLNPKCRR